MGVIEVLASAVTGAGIAVIANWSGGFFQERSRRREAEREYLEQGYALSQELLEWASGRVTAEIARQAGQEIGTDLKNQSCRELRALVRLHLPSLRDAEAALWPIARTFYRTVGDREFRVLGAPGAVRLEPGKTIEGEFDRLQAALETFMGAIEQRMRQLE